MTMGSYPRGLGASLAAVTVGAILAFAITASTPGISLPAVGTMVGFLTSSAEERRNVYKVGLNTTRLLMGVGDLVTGWLLLRQAEVAQAKLDADATGNALSEKDRAFYAGKLTTARWFAANVLPELHSKRGIAESTDLALMDPDEASF